MMIRSMYKGPYVEHCLITQIQKLKRSKPNIMNIIIRTRSRRSTIISDFVGLKFDVYNGKKYFLVHVNQQMIGMKLGDFSPTRNFVKHSGDKVRNNKAPVKKRNKI